MSFSTEAAELKRWQHMTPSLYDTFDEVKDAWGDLKYFHETHNGLPERYEDFVQVMSSKLQKAIAELEPHTRLPDSKIFAGMSYNSNIEPPVEFHFKILHNSTVIFRSVCAHPVTLLEAKVQSLLEYPGNVVDHVIQEGRGILKEQFRIIFDSIPTKPGAVPKELERKMQRGIEDALNALQDQMEETAVAVKFSTAYQSTRIDDPYRFRCSAMTSEERDSAVGEV